MHLHALHVAVGGAQALLAAADLCAQLLKFHLLLLRPVQAAAQIMRRPSDTGAS